MTHAEKIAFHGKVYPLARRLANSPSSAKYIEPIALTKSEYAHAEYLDYNMRYFYKMRERRKAA